MKEENQKNYLYKELEENFLLWANKIDHLRGAILIGTRAQIEPPADEWGDLDIAIFTTNPDELIDNTDWIRNLGEPILAYTIQIEGLAKTYRVLFKEGLEADLAICLYDDKKEYIQLLDQHPDFINWLDLFCFGSRVIVDKDGVLNQIFTLLEKKETCRPAYIYNSKFTYMDQNLPSENEFLLKLTEFLHHIFIVAKMIRRGELWRTRIAFSEFKGNQLYELIMWHTFAHQGLNHEIQEDLLRDIYRKRFFEKWVDQEILNELLQIYSSYEEDDIWDEIFKILEIFQRIAREIADKIEYSYPDETFRNVKQLIHELYSTRS